MQVQYAGPAIDISYPVLYPPPPSAPAPEDTMNILIQRVPTRGFKKDKEAKTGANRFEDEGKREQYKRSACDRERARMKDMNKSFEQVGLFLQQQYLPLSPPSSTNLTFPFVGLADELFHAAAGTPPLPQASGQKTFQD